MHIVRQNANPGTHDTPPLDEIYASPEMLAYGIMVNTVHRLPICTMCGCGILAPYLISHVHEQHDLKIPVSVMDHWIALLDLERDHRALDFPTYPREPLEGLKVFQGFACAVTDCTTIQGTYASMASHASSNHRGLGAKATAVEAFFQRVYRGPGQPKYLRVSSNIPTPASSNTYLEALLANRSPTVTIKVPSKAREMSPWLTELGWHKRVSKLSEETGQALRDSTRVPPSNDPNTVLRQALYTYLSLAGEATTLVPTYVRLALKAKTE